ncbi:MAG: hypothetical protein IJT79_04190 [Ruminococcus sp.]|nr:hypothetical protein [Ruminococcus sp.]
MRGRYKEVATICQNKYIDLDIIPEFRQAKGNRRKKHKPTSNAQKIYNERKRGKEVTQLINHNFKENDIFTTLTYDNAHLPRDERAAKKQAANFIRRVRRFCIKNNLPELKYIICTERTERTGRLHHHIIINGSGLLFESINKLWGKGNINDIKPLHFDEQNGVEGLAHYFLKQPLNGNAYTCSRNLKQPERETHTGRLTRKELRYMARFGDVSPLRRLYPEREYNIVDYRVIYNEVNGYYYFAVKLLLKYKQKKEKQSAARHRGRAAKHNSGERLRI